jgi:K+-sensing histidine kinase KdpD
MKRTPRNAWRPHGSRRSLLAYGGSVLGVGLAALFTHVIAPLQAVPTLAFTAAVALTAWLCGRRPAILAITLSALAVDYLFLSPPGFLLSSVTAVACVANFAFVAWLICYLQESLGRNTADLRRVNDMVSRKAANHFRGIGRVDQQAPPWPRSARLSFPIRFVPPARSVS